MDVKFKGAGTSGVARSRGDGAFVPGRGLVSLVVAFTLALALPFLLAWNQPPSPTFYNQAAALAGWCGVVIVLSLWLPGRDLLYRGGLDLLWWALGLLLLAVLMSPVWAALPWAISLSAAGVVVAAGLVASMGAAASQARQTVAVFRPLAWVLAVAGLLSAGVAVIQLFAPGLADGTFVARSGGGGRAAGNLRQANHLATLMLWSVVAVVWLAERRLRRPVHDAAFAPTVLESRWAAEQPQALKARPRWSAAQRERLRTWLLLAAGVVPLVAGVVFSGSRTGVLGLLLLAGWGLWDRRLTPGARAALVGAPLVALGVWAGLQLLAGSGADAAAGAAVAAAAQNLTRPGSDLSSSRLAIWRDTLELIVQNPLLGVGFGEFNFAWTLTPSPDRPVEFFDHAHNLPLQLMVELGVPLALAVMGLLLWTLRRAGQQAWRQEGEHGLALRTAFVMVLLMVVHSQLEYPLWYAHFLLPTAFLLGLCIAGQERRSAALRPDEINRSPVRTSLMVALIGLAVTAAAVWDYQRVVAIFKPPAGSGSLEQRIAEGRRSWFFAHHADYAAVTTAARPSAVMPAFDRAAHHLLDARLMRAWAQALHETNQVDRSRHLAQRLAEFRNPQAAEFFAICADPVAALAVREVAAAPNGDGAASAASAAASVASPTPPLPAPLSPPPRASWVDMAASFPTPVPPRSLPKGPPSQPLDPAFAESGLPALPFQCLKPTRALGYLDFR